MKFDDSVSPYNDRFKTSHRWSRLLFRANRPLFNSELNEMQSTLLEQVNRLGDSQFKDGSIISGMEVTMDKKNNVNPNTKGNPSLITFSSLQNSNSRVLTDNYLKDGSISLQTTATLTDAYIGLKFTVDTKDNQKDFTLSFSVKRDSGNLYKLSGIFDKSLTVSKYQIDGNDMKTNFDDNTNKPLKNANGDQVNLSDGNTHQVVVTFTGATGQGYSITIQANAGYNALNEGAVNYTLGKFKAESGDSVTNWRPATSDENANTGGNRNLNVMVSDGYVYMSGQVRYFEEQSIKVTGVGLEKIGANLQDDVVTANDDSSLLDHTPGAPAQFKPGADRLHYTVGLSYNDNTCPTIFELQDGNLTLNQVRPISATLNDILARRTNDESGSYAVSGFKLWSEPDDLDDSVVDVYADSGTAYVQGYQIIKSTSTKIKVPKAVQTADIADEVKLFDKNNPTITVANQPVKTINQLSGNVEVDDEAVYRDSSLATHDTLKNQAYEIKEVYAMDKSSKKTYYKQGVDFNLVSGNEIAWDVSENSHAPTVGSTYYVTYDYQAIFDVDKDYKVTTTGEDDEQITSISFDGMNGRKPVDKSQLHVSYTYFLARIDVLTMNRDGNLTLVSGQPNKVNEVRHASHIDPLTLTLGYITVYPNSDRADTQSQTIYRIPFTGLQDLVSRIDNLETNMSISEQRYASMANQDPVTMRDIFSDNFTSVDKMDTGNKAFSARTNINGGNITLQDEVSMEEPSVEDQPNSNVYHFLNLVTPEFTDSPYISQSLATGVENINPFDNFQNVADLVLDPSADNWIDEKKTTVNNEQHDADTGYGSSSNRVETGTTTNVTATDTVEEFMRQRKIHFVASNLMPMADNLVMAFDDKTVSITPDSGFNAGTKDGTIRSDGDGTAKGTFEIPENIHVGVRQAKISNDQNIATTLYTANGIERTYTTTNTKHWHNDYWEPAPIYTPSYDEPDDSYTPTPDPTPVTPSGHYETEYHGYNNKVHGGWEDANGNFITDQYADGQHNDFGDNSAYVPDPDGGFDQETQVWVTDPVAQSFNVDRDCVITSANLYFAGMPDVSSIKRGDIRVEIRTMSNGMPANTTIGLGVVSPNDVKVSKDGSVATKVNFRTPLIATKGTSYAMCLLTSSDAYSMYVATIGDKDIQSGKVVSSPAYIGGSFFISRNAETWTPMSDTSLKFDMNKASFVKTATETYQPITVAGQYFTDYKGNQVLDAQNNPIQLIISHAVMLDNYVTLDNSKLNWEFRYVLDRQPEDTDITSVAWQPFSDKTDVLFREKIRSIQFRVNFTGSQDMPPFLTADSVNFVVYKTSKYGVYLSRDMDMTNTPYNHLRTSYEVCSPSGANVVPEYSTDKGKTWNTYDKAYTRVTKIDRNYNKYEYDLQLYDQAHGVQTKANDFKIRLNMVSDNNYGQPLVRRLMNSMSLQDGNEVGNNGWVSPEKNAPLQQGTIIWSSNGTDSNPDATLVRELSAIPQDILIHFVDKFGAPFDLTIPATSLTTNQAYNLKLGKGTGSVTKVSDTELKFADVTDYFPVEISAFYADTDDTTTTKK